MQTARQPALRITPAIRKQIVEIIDHRIREVHVIQKHYPGDCVPLLITHFARPTVLDAAREKGIVVVQSFEW